MIEKKENIVERFSSSAIALIIANIIPVAGVVFLGWSVAPIMLLYWAENLVVGFFNIIKMRKAEGAIESNTYTMNNKPITQADRNSMIGFFIMHYGMFTLVHGAFVIAFFCVQYKGSFRGLMPVVLMLFISHAISYKQNFVGKEEYKQVSFAQLFWQPYKRVIIMHITILGGGALVQEKGSPLYALLIMVALKTIIDLFSHYFEHRKFQLSP